MKSLRELLFGAARNPMSKETRTHIALVAFLAWIGLGADGLSSACYGPEEAFKALGIHTHLAIFLAMATAFTVFLISSAYNQVIRLFPNGGGGYKVASKLLGPHAGLVSGTALVIDYMLTITISVAAGCDALFSLLPYHYQAYKLTTEALILLILIWLNLRGAKESVKFLMPIFLGFFLTHLVMIILGISMRGNDIAPLIQITRAETHDAIMSLGWPAVLALFMRAYSLGGGTYTGLEAVSNNVQILAEPRVKTGSWTMFYMALSLSLVAGGIILLYLLWNASPVPGKTLNAVVFSHILVNMPFSHFWLVLLLALEAGILFVGANTGFLGGPAVLANMAVDSWAPKRFSLLSSRLVTENGILFFGCAALVLLFATDGDVSFLVVLYSMNVFLTFSMSLWGLTTYWWRHREENNHWFWQMLLSTTALIVCLLVLLITLISKFELGGWITVVVTGSAVACGLYIHRYYKKFEILRKDLDKSLVLPLMPEENRSSQLDPTEPTAVYLVKDIGAAMHTVLWTQRLFPNYFRNYVFVSYGEVDIGSFGSEDALIKLKEQTAGLLDYLVQYMQQNGYHAEAYSNYGTDVIEGIYHLAETINEKYPNTLYFTSRYVYPSENWLTRILHADFSIIIQRRLQHLAIKMLVLPLNLKI